MDFSIFLHIKTSPYSNNMSSQTQISKHLSWILRHGINELNLSISLDGYVKLDDVLGFPKGKRHRFETTRETANCKLLEETGINLDTCTEFYGKYVAYFIHIS
jgi:hypothetical protein